MASGGWTPLSVLIPWITYRRAYPLMRDGTVNPRKRCEVHFLKVILLVILHVLPNSIWSGLEQVDAPSPPVSLTLLFMPLSAFEATMPNSLMVGSTKIRICLLQSVPYRCSTYKHVQHLCFQVLTTLIDILYIVRIHLKVLTLIYQSCSQASIWLYPPILSSAVAPLHPLRSLDGHNLFVPRSKTSLLYFRAKRRVLAIIGLALWNQLTPLTRSSILACESIYASIRYLFSHTKSASDWGAPRVALYKCIDAIQKICITIVV